MWVNLWTGRNSKLEYNLLLLSPKVTFAARRWKTVSSVGWQISRLVCCLFSLLSRRHCPSFLPKATAFQAMVSTLHVMPRRMTSALTAGKQSPLLRRHCLGIKWHYTLHWNLALHVPAWEVPCRKRIELNLSAMWIGLKTSKYWKFEDLEVSC